MDFELLKELEKMERHLHGVLCVFVFTFALLHFLQAQDEKGMIFDQKSIMFSNSSLDYINSWSN